MHYTRLSVICTLCGCEHNNSGNSQQQTCTCTGNDIVVMRISLVHNSRHVHIYTCVVVSMAIVVIHHIADLVPTVHVKLNL